MRSRDEGVIPELLTCVSVSDIGATAPISALTNAFSIPSIRPPYTDDFAPEIIELQQ
jgi:hypothetical protein